MTVTLAAIPAAILVVGLLAAVYVVAPRIRAGATARPIEDPAPEEAPEQVVYRELYGPRSLAATACRPGGPRRASSGARSETSR